MKTKLTIREKIEFLLLMSPVLAILIVAPLRAMGANPTGIADTAKAATAAAERACVLHRERTDPALNPIGSGTAVRRHAEAVEWCRAQRAAAELERAARLHAANR